MTKMRITPEKKVLLQGEIIEQDTKNILTTEGNLISKSFDEIKEVEVISYRNIEVGDDLSGKTLYFNFPDNLYSSYVDDSFYYKDIINTEGCYIKNHTSTTNNITWIILWPESIGATLYTAQKNGSNYIVSKLDNILLPNNAGVVTKLNKTDPAYQYFKIAESSTITVPIEKFNITTDSIEAVEFIEQ